MKLFVGLDIGLNKTALCCVDEKGETVLACMVASEPSALIAKLNKFRRQIELIGLEACPLSEWLYGALSEDGFEVFCLETRHTQRFLSSRPNKTDRTDAHGIATMMRLGHFKPVHVKSLSSQYMRARLTARKQFVTTMLQIENTIRGLVRIQGLKVRQVHRNKFSDKVRTLCEGHPEIWLAIEPLLEARDTMRKQLHTLTLGLEREARNDPICKLFMTIPGVGPLTSLSFKAIIDDPRRFKSSKLVPAHLGLTPRVYQSGEMDRSGRISKSGDKLLRYHLVNAATSMLLISQKWCSIKAWGIRLANKKGKAKAIIAVARKIAIVMHKMWLSGEPFQFGSEVPTPESP
jgi:transposase